MLALSLFSSQRLDDIFTAFSYITFASVNRTHQVSIGLKKKTQELK